MVYFNFWGNIMKKYLYAIAGTILLTACTDRLQELENSCNANNGKDCLELAHIYETGKEVEGKEVEKDNLKAIEFYKKACHSGDVGICLSVAETYFDGKKGITKNAAEGTFYLEKACDLGDAETCYKVALLLADGTITTKNIDKSNSYFEKSCNMGHGISCANIASKYMLGQDKLDIDLVKALNLAEKGCKLDAGISCLAASAVYAIKNDKANARLYMGKACNLDNAEGCESLIKMAINANDIAAPDVKKASEKLCNLKNGLGCKMSASFFMGDKNKVEALRLFTEACDLNEADACLVAANLYNNADQNQGIQKDEVKAFTLYTKACQLGNQDGCLALSETGKWIEKTEKDEFTGNVNVYYFNSSVDSFNAGYGTQTHPTIWARCKDNSTEVNIYFDTVMTCGDGMKIGLKFDDEKSFYEYWNGSTSCKALFSRQPVKLLKKMVGKKKMMVRFTPYASGTYNVTFDLRGIDKVVENLSSACHWKK